MAADPAELAARPGFLRLLTRLRGGEEECGRCKGTKEIHVVRIPQSGWNDAYAAKAICSDCSGSGRVAVPPDPRPDQQGAVIADFWLDAGGDLAGMLRCYAFPPLWEGEAPPGRRPVLLHDDGTNTPLRCLSWEDDSLRPALAALDDVGCPARAAAVRGLEVRHYPRLPGHQWRAGYHPGGPPARPTSWHPTEPAVRTALKRAVLGLYDPCPACGGEGRVSYGEQGGLVEGCLDCGGTGNGPRGWPGVPVPCPACGGKQLKRFPDGINADWACQTCHGRGTVAPSALLAPPGR